MAKTKTTATQKSAVPQNPAAQVPDQIPTQPTAPRGNDLCPHVFVGGADGVQCTICGLKLTTEKFRELLKADN